MTSEAAFDDEADTTRHLEAPIDVENTTEKEEIDHAFMEEAPIKATTASMFHPGEQQEAIVIKDQAASEKEDIEL